MSRTLLSLLFAACLLTSAVVSAADAPAGWTTHAAREEIKPQCSYDARGGRRGAGCFVLSADDRDGLAGWWQKSFPATGGKHYRFAAWRKTENIESPRRAAVARVLWQDGKGQPVTHEEISDAPYAPGKKPRAEPEYPTDKTTDDAGWTEVSDAYLAPPGATQAVVELHYRWAAKGRVMWSDVSLQEVDPPQPRIVRLATVHFQPRAGKTPAEKCRLFAPLIEKAAEQHADFVVLPETLTYYGTGLPMFECAESIPGPSTDYFGQLAKQHDLYIVAGLVERDRHLMYNVAVLIGPDGQIVGKYRKVCLPRSEIEAGVQPGSDYPVFDTRFGRVGMMVCYDGFFPEVARELSNIENLQRSDLNALEEAHAFRRLVDEFWLTHEDVGARVGRSRSAVANTLRLLDLDERVQDALTAGQITEGHARALAGLPDAAEQAAALSQVLSSGLSVRQTEELVRRSIKRTPRSKRAASARPADVERLERGLREALATKVTLSTSRKGGKITIEYYTQEELERLYERLTGGAG